MHHRSRFLFLSLSLVAIVAACSSGGGAASPSAAAPSVAAPSVAAPSVAPSEAAPSEAAPSVAAGGVELKVAESALGQIIVDGTDVTLYGFTPDEAGTPTCYEGCATNWPPLLADDPAAVTVAAGLDASKLTTVDRTDGGKQLKYGNWPLYYFAKDTASGQTNGQGVGESWYVIAPSGDLFKG